MRVHNCVSTIGMSSVSFKMRVVVRTKKVDPVPVFMKKVIISTYYIRLCTKRVKNLNSLTLQLPNWQKLLTLVFKNKNIC